MEYSEKIIKAYNNWMQKLTDTPSDEWEDGYAKKRRAEKRAGDKFEATCISDGLNYIEVASALTPNIIKL